ncbi:ATP-binding cassette domain-containing protein [Rhodococcus corynebacterioides]|uniref:ATP-binding cassette domain-containing protein n=1 Tax=Rhodococcoides corynebacterioides TaxID=53972 RepID=A0ABS7NZG3_9NOCA|nr:ATP-binding cassette domain-containing protein [Rhodococcus corynebacterioides]MBY6408622.1 ATP-binding cassette domain-containing protein [Rhodococcus corynebacterioides]
MRYGATVAVDDVTVRIAAGDRVALVGASGSGKSSVLRALLALRAPDAGTVTLDGRPVGPGPARAVRPFRRAVQFVPQDPGASLDPRTSVLAAVAAPLRWLHVPGDRRDRARRALQSVDLDESILRVRADRLSGGQKQRVAIARALACEPRFLLADEPVSGLDGGTRDVVLDVLVRLGPDTALLMVTHDLAVAARVATRVLVMADGRLVEYGPVDDVLTAPTHPATRALVAAVPRLDGTVAQPI